MILSGVNKQLSEKIKCYLEYIWNEEKNIYET